MLVISVLQMLDTMHIMLKVPIKQAFENLLFSLVQMSQNLAHMCAACGIHVKTACMMTSCSSSSVYDSRLDHRPCQSVQAPFVLTRWIKSTITKY